MSQTCLVELREASAWFYLSSPVALSQPSRTHLRLGAHLLPLRTLRVSRGLGRDEYVLTSGRRLVLFVRPARAAPDDWPAALALLGASPRYTLLKELGRGAFGVVHRARRRDGTLVAVKRVAKKDLRCSKNAYLAARREGALARVLPPHPNIVKALDIRETRAHFITVMEVVEGGSLLDCVRKGSLSRPAIVTVVRQLLSAVAHLHANGVVHRDVKLENILVENPAASLPNVKLCDLGLAIEEHLLPKEAERGNRPGTDYVLAPEMVLKGAGSCGKQIDVWACGIVLFSMLYRRVPWTDETSARAQQMTVMKQLSSDMRPSIHVVQTADERLQTPKLLHSLLSGLLHPDPERRLTARAALEHPVFQSPVPPTTTVVANGTAAKSLPRQTRSLLIGQPPSFKRFATIILEMMRVIESLQIRKVGTISGGLVVL